MRRVCSVLFLSVVVSATAASQQTSRSIEPGARIRFTGTETTLIGTFSLLRGDTLFMRTGQVGEAPVAVPLSYLQKLEVSRARPTAAFHGLLKRTIFGAIAGVGTGVARAMIYEDESLPEGIEKMAPLTLGGGAVIGLVYGILQRRDVWEEVPLDGVRVGFGPRHEGLGIGARIAL